MSTSTGLIRSFDYDWGAIDRALGAAAGKGGNPHQRRFRPLGDLPLFEKILCINGLGDILAVESSYEEGCKWGAILPPLLRADLKKYSINPILNPAGWLLAARAGVFSSRK